MANRPNNLKSRILDRDTGQAQYIVSIRDRRPRTSPFARERSSVVLVVDDLALNHDLLV